MEAPGDLPGFRRRIQITPAPGEVRAALEDDFHHMIVNVRHANGVATSVEGEMVRAPWTTCPGAAVALQRTFTGVALKDFAARNSAKPNNCTHLFDLAQWAAAHAGDTATKRYDVLVSDPIEGVRRAELRRDGESVFIWSFEDHRMVAPPELAGQMLFEMHDWIGTLAPKDKEAACILRWASLVANGRLIPLPEQSDATKMPSGACFTFQPETAKRAIRVGEIKDFSTQAAQPLE